MTGPALPRPLPAGQAIVWRPSAASGARTGDAYPIYVKPKVLQALNEHFLATRKHGVLGFLVGDWCQDARSGASHVVVDSTIRLNQAIYGDRVGVVLEKLWSRVQHELDAVRGHLLGWYHSHPPDGIGLAPGDVEAHLLLFTQPWQFALVLGAEATGPAAGFYRPAHDAFSATTRLSFHELAGPGGSAPGAARRSSLPWTNFVTDEPVIYRAQEQADAARAAAGAATRATLEVTGRELTVTAAGPPPPPPPPAPPPVSPGPRPGALTGLPLIHEVPAVAAPAEPSPAPVPPPRRPAASPRSSPVPPPAREPRPSRQLSRPRPSGSWRIVGLTTLVLAGVVVGAWKTGLIPLTRGSAASPPDAAPPGADAFDRLADSVVRAVADYGERARLFDTRRMGCDGLQRGLVGVEQGWIAYSARGKARVPVLDAARAQRDRTLYASVDSVDRHFQGSQCERP